MKFNKEFSIEKEKQRKDLSEVFIPIEKHERLKQSEKEIKDLSEVFIPIKKRSLFS